MAVQIKVDQSGKPAGVAGQAREDLVTGTAVTLTAIGGPFGAHQWTIIDKPIDIEAAARSSASLATPTNAVTSLTPIDVPGTHLVRLAVDSGSGLGAGPDDVAEITFYAGTSGSTTLGDLAADPTFLPRRIPATREQAHHNAPDAIDAGGNPDGWAREWLRWFSIVRKLWVRQFFAAAIVTNDGVSATLGRQFGISGVVRTGAGVVRVSFSSAFPDANYAAFALPIGSVGGSAVVTSRTTTTCDVERGDASGAIADADFVVVAILRV